MKNLFFLILVLSNLHLTAQSTYRPVISPKNEWGVDYKHSSFPVQIRRYTFSTDSMLLNGQYYRELIYSNNMNGGPWEQTDVFYRQQNAKVYVKWSAPNQAERLIYDFDMVINDTLVPNADMKQKDRRITQVGTLKLLDNAPRKFLEMQSSACPGGANIWIEAMGDRDYLFRTDTYCSLADENVYRHIRCFSTDGQLLYIRPDLTGCYTSSVPDLALPAMHIFPNPGTGLLQITLPDAPETQSVQVQFADLTGRIMWSNRIMADDNTLSVDARSLPDGVYFCKVRAAQREYLPVKMVINR